MPTRRFGKVRWWLKHGEAHVIHRTPFTIRMDRDTTSYADLITVGADAGGGHVGISASSAKREYIRIEVELRQDVKKKNSDRKECRRNRRGRKTRYRKPRFDNRGRKGFIAPTVEQKTRSHVNVISLVCSILPVARCVVEAAPFDTQKLEFLA